jgi:hypothetical protein
MDGWLLIVLNFLRTFLRVLVHRFWSTGSGLHGLIFDFASAKREAKNKSQNETEITPNRMKRCTSKDVKTYRTFTFTFISLKKYLRNYYKITVIVPEIMENKKESLDIVTMITSNSIISLSGDYQSKLLNKINVHFTPEQQKMYITSLYCSVNYSQTKDFIINFDDVWRWVGFDRKNNAKRLLESNFREDVDFNIGFATPKRAAKNKSQNETENRGGHNEETIMLNIRTFKKFCLKARTKQADEIHDYYVRLEEIVNETVKEEAEDLKRLMAIQDRKMIKTERNLKNTRLKLKKVEEKTLIKLLDGKSVNYSAHACEIEIDGVKYKVKKFGISDEIQKRVYQHRSKNEFGQEFQIEYLKESIFYRRIEKKIKDELKEYIINTPEELDLLPSNLKHKTELIKITPEFTEEMFKDKIDEYRDYFYKPERLLESLDKIDILEKELIETREELIETREELLKYTTNNEIITLAVSDAEKKDIQRSQYCLSFLEELISEYPEQLQPVTILTSDLYNKYEKYIDMNSLQFYKYSKNEFGSKINISEYIKTAAKRNIGDDIPGKKSSVKILDIKRLPEWINNRRKELEFNIKGSVTEKTEIKDAQTERERLKNVQEIKLWKFVKHVLTNSTETDIKIVKKELMDSYKENDKTHIITKIVFGRILSKCPYIQQDCRLSIPGETVRPHAYGFNRDLTIKWIKENRLINN